MTIIFKLVNGHTEIHEGKDFEASTPKETRPEIMAFKVLSNTGRILVKWRRPFPYFYKKYIYKPENVEVKGDQVTKDE